MLVFVITKKKHHIILFDIFVTAVVKKNVRVDSKYAQNNQNSSTITTRFMH